LRTCCHPHRWHCNSSTCSESFCPGLHTPFQQWSVNKVQSLYTESLDVNGKDSCEPIPQSVPDDVGSTDKDPNKHLQITEDLPHTHTRTHTQPMALSIWMLRRSELHSLHSLPSIATMREHVRNLNFVTSFGWYSTNWPLKIWYSAGWNFTESVADQTQSAKSYWLHGSAGNVWQPLLPKFIPPYVALSRLP